MKNPLSQPDYFEDVMEDPFQNVPSELRHLIPGFIDRREKEVCELFLLLKAKDFVGIGDIAHKLKGVGTGYGFEFLTEIGAQLELAAKNKDQIGVGEYVEELARAASELKGSWVLREDA